MKKIFITILAMLVISSLTFALFACKDDNATDIPPADNVVEDDPNEPELVRKVHAIYYANNVEPQSVTSVQKLAILTSISYTIDDSGPIGITPARLNGKDITLVTLGGTEMVEGQATTMRESQLASFGMDNDYLRAVVKLFDNGTVPSDKPVLIAGISLGGMIAQQLISKVSNSHDIEAIITFGSPLTKPYDRQGIKVVRFVDSHDLVPVMGESMIFGVDVSALDNAEKIVRTSKYTDMIETHALSYIEDECWNEFDFLGDSTKDNTLELIEKMTFYDAPKM